MMAVKLIRCHRVVTYLPSLRAAVINRKAFSSAGEESEFDFFFKENSERSSGKKTIWPDDILGPLGPQDKRFPLPGRIGPCINSRRLAQQQLNKERQFPLKLPFDVNEALPQTAANRHEDICEQFLTSVDEVELEFVDQKMSESSDQSPSSSDKMEFRAHSCPHVLRKDFKDLFPDKNIMDGNFTVVIISFKTENDQTLWSEEVEQERENMLENFIQGAVELCQAFEDSGFWADFIDPESGKPFKGPHTNFTLFETDERYRKLGFDIKDLGCCKVVSHPVWGSHAYIGALFTDAPINHPLVSALNS